MTKTPARRQQARRDRLKQNPEKYDAYKAKDRDRKTEGKLRMSEEEKAALKRRTKLAMRKSRLKNAQMEAAANGERFTPYRCHAPAGKARQRAARALPKSPRKRAFIVKSLVKEYINDVVQGVIPSPSRGLPSEDIDTITDFYLSDSISRVMPGKADTIVIRSPNEPKRKETKRHLTVTISEAYQLFRADHPDISVGKSKFAELRPAHVLLCSQMPHNVCACQYHANIILLLEGLHRQIPEIPLYSWAGFLPIVVCDVDSEVCMLNDCPTCKDGVLLDNLIESNPEKDQIIHWHRWSKKEDGFLLKEACSGGVDEAISKLKDQLPRFLWHVFIKHKQQKAYEEDKTRAAEPSSSFCFLQMDFAENYTCTFQDEVQSAHWKQRQVTIYTVMIHHRNSTCPIVIVTDQRSSIGVSL